MPPEQQLRRLGEQSGQLIFFTDFTAPETSPHKRTRSTGTWKTSEGRNIAERR
jgi:hypothetical protein